jgi:hypothetical protein
MNCFISSNKKLSFSIKFDLFWINMPKYLPIYKMTSKPNQSGHSIRFYLQPCLIYIFLLDGYIRPNLLLPQRLRVSSHILVLILLFTRLKEPLINNPLLAIFGNCYIRDEEKGEVFLEFDKLFLDIFKRHAERTM